MEFEGRVNRVLSLSNAVNAIVSFCALVPLFFFLVYCRAALSAETALKQAVSKAMQSVVVVRSEGQTVSEAIGISVDQGVIITSRSIAKKNGKITVKLPDGRTLSAKIIAGDATWEFAALTVDANVHLPSVEFSDSDSLYLGDRVILFGLPAKTVQVGQFEGKVKQPERKGDLLRIGTTTVVPIGEGPVWDDTGKLVGLTVEIQDRDGKVRRGAIPGNEIRESLRRFSGKKLKDQGMDR